MKSIILIIIVFLFGCDKTEPNFEFVAIQHIGKGIMNGDSCRTLYREDGHNVKTPEKFKITPYQVVMLAKENLGYSCGHKLGAQILADKENYYIVRLDFIQDAIIINGKNGSIISEGFMERLN